MVDVGHGKENSALHGKILALLKKKNLSKKELEELEEIKKKEEDEILEELAQTVREMRDEEEERFLEEQRKRARKKNEENRESLERSVEEENINRSNSVKGSNSNSYTGFGFQSNPEGKYNMAEKGVYEKFKEIMHTPIDQRSSEDKNFLKGVEDSVNQFNRMDSMTRKKEDPYEQVARIQNWISAFYK